MNDQSLTISATCQSNIDRYLEKEPRVRKILEVLIEWAKFKYDKGTYKELATRIGFDKGEQFLGRDLAKADDVRYYISDKAKLYIPILNGLVKNKETKIPSEGFEYVYEHYNDLNDEEKSIFVDGLNKKVFSYKKWDQIARIVGVKIAPLPTQDDEDLIRKNNNSYKGDSLECYNRWKNYIYEHPIVVDIKNSENGDKYMDYGLLSGDKIDVYVKLENRNNIAIKVLYENASELEVLQALYVCAKYKNMLNLEDVAHGHNFRNKGLLVIGEQLSLTNKYVANLLGVDVYEDFEINE